MDKKIEEAFGAVTKVLFGKAFAELRDYAAWLESNVTRPIEQPSALSGKIIYIQPFRFYHAVKEKTVKLEEAEGKLALSRKDAETITLSHASEKLAAITYFSPEVIRGKNLSVEECGTYADSSYCFHGTLFVNSRYCAYCLWPRDSEYVMGSSFIFSSKFCLKCHNSSHLTRCFEVSHSSSCSDCYFCHNCENLTECMFCFNTKAKRYAIANRELGREEYMGIKKRIQEQVAKELEAKKKLDYDIYGLA